MNIKNSTYNIDIIIRVLLNDKSFLEKYFALSDKFTKDPWERYCILPNGAGPGYVNFFTGEILLDDEYNRRFPMKKDANIPSD